jgi:hypothetical protein
MFDAPDMLDTEITPGDAGDGGAGAGELGTGDKGVSALTQSFDF